MPTATKMKDWYKKYLNMRIVYPYIDMTHGLKKDLDTVFKEDVETWFRLPEYKTPEPLAYAIESSMWDSIKDRFARKFNRSWIHDLEDDLKRIHKI